MRVENISLNNSNNFTTINNVKNNHRFTSNADTISFSAKKKNEIQEKTFIQKLRGVFFDKKELLPEEKKSEEIKADISSLNNIKKITNKNAKTYTKLLKGYMALGRNNGWFSVAIGKDERLLFSGLEDNLSGKQTITRLDMSNGMDIKETYDIHSLFGYSFTVNYKLDDITDCSLNVLSERALSFSEVDNDTGIKRTLIPRLDGFYFISGQPNKDGEILNPDSEINYVFDNFEDSYYREKNSIGNVDTYKYNPNSDLWEIQKDD